MAPSHVKAKQFFLYLWVFKNKGSIATEGWRQFSTLQGGYAHNLENAQNLLIFGGYLYSVEQIKKEHSVTGWDSDADWGRSTAPAELLGAEAHKAMCKAGISAPV